MAYMSQIKKKQIKVELDKILKGTGFKYSVGVNNHSTIVLNLYSGPIDFISDYNTTYRSPYNETLCGDNACTNAYIQVNPYHFGSHFTGEAKELLTKLFKALNEGNWDNSDIQTDYFDKGWYTEVNIGKWDRPYVCTK
jgi:hypothetical protein